MRISLYFSASELILSLRVSPSPRRKIRSKSKREHSVINYFLNCELPEWQNNNIIHILSVLWFTTKKQCEKRE